MKTFLKEVEILLKAIEYDDQRKCSVCYDDVSIDDVEMKLLDMKLLNEQTIYCLQSAITQIKHLTQLLKNKTGLEYESSKMEIRDLLETIEKLKQ